MKTFIFLGLSSRSGLKYITLYSDLNDILKHLSTHIFNIKGDARVISPCSYFSIMEQKIVNGLFVVCKKNKRLTINTFHVDLLVKVAHRYFCRINSNELYEDFETPGLVNFSDPCDPVFYFYRNETFMLPALEAEDLWCFENIKNSVISRVCYDLINKYYCHNSSGFYVNPDKYLARVESEMIVLNFYKQKDRLNAEMKKNLLWIFGGQALEVIRYTKPSVDAVDPPVSGKLSPAKQYH